MILDILTLASIVGVFITGIFNYCVANKSSRTLKQIEKQKQLNGIIEYRYIELHKNLMILSSNQPLSLRFEPEDYVNCSKAITERFNSALNSYLVMKPLFDTENTKGIDALLEHEKHLSRLLIEATYKHEENIAMVSEALDIRQQFCQRLIASSQLQIKQLLQQ